LSFVDEYEGDVAVLVGEGAEKEDEEVEEVLVVLVIVVALEVMWLVRTAKRRLLGVVMASLVMSSIVTRYAATPAAIAIDCLNLACRVLLNSTWLKGRDTFIFTRYITLVLLVLLTVDSLLVPPVASPTAFIGSTPS
jgi:hypothetical protein